MEDLNIHQKIVLKKDGTEQSLSYQNNNQKIYRTLNENEYDALFSKLRPNIDFSLPDRLIQSFVKDGTILPSYKNSRLFNMDDFNSIVSPLKRELSFLSKLQSNKNNKYKRKTGLNRITMKKNKQSIKDKLLKQLKVVRNKSSTQKKPKKVHTKGPGKKKRELKDKDKGKGKGKGKDKRNTKNKGKSKK